MTDTAVWLGQKSGEGNTGGRIGLRSLGCELRDLQKLLSFSVPRQQRGDGSVCLVGLCHPQLHAFWRVPCGLPVARGRLLAVGSVWQCAGRVGVRRWQTGFVKGQYSRKQGEQKGRVDDDSQLPGLSDWETRRTEQKS